MSANIYELIVSCGTLVRLFVMRSMSIPTLQLVEAFEVAQEIQSFLLAFRAPSLSGLLFLCQIHILERREPGRSTVDESMCTKKGIGA